MDRVRATAGTADLVPPPLEAGFRGDAQEIGQGERVGADGRRNISDGGRGDGEAGHAATGFAATLVRGSPVLQSKAR